MSTYSDQELLSRIIEDDDQKAFEQLYLRYAPKFLVLAKQKLNSLAIAEEIVQDLFVKLWKLRHQIEIKTNFNGYLYTMLQNEVLQYIRKSYNKVSFMDQMVLLNKEQTTYPAEPLAFEELMDRLERIIEKMPKKSKEIFRLRYDKNLEVEEIADKLDLPQQTVRNQLSTTLKQIRLDIGSVSILIIIKLLSETLNS